MAECPLNALCKIIREEYPKFRCTYVAIDPRESPTESCETLFDELRSGTDEPQIAFRKGERLVPRFTRWEVETVLIPKFSPKASYLVAGGFRPLGILLARWYVSHGAKHVILLDEIEIVPEVAAIIEDLQKAGTNTITAKIKLEDEEALMNVFEKIGREVPPLQGVIHAAGLVDNDLIMHMNWDRFKSVHRLKVSLSWNLHRFTQQFNLDHFILFSSCLPDMSPLGKGNHATGNSFLDVLSHYRKKRALPSLTIDWGPWESRHMDVKRLVETAPSERVRMLRIDEGLQVLDHLFYMHKPQITAVFVNWLVLLHSIGDVNPLFNEIAIEMGFKRVDILRRYLEAKQEDRLAIIQSYIHEKVRSVLNLKSSQMLEYGRDFKKLGMDSSRMTNLKNHIQFDLDEALKLPFNLVEENPTIEQLSNALSKALESEIQSKPQSKLKALVAMIGFDNDKVAIEVINNEKAKVQMTVLSEELIHTLEDKLKSQNDEHKPKSSIVIIDKI